MSEGPSEGLLGSRAGAKLGKIKTLGAADRVILFQAIMPVHCAFCIAGILMSLAPIICAPSVWFAGMLVAGFFVIIMGARWSVASLEDRERALHLFGLQWLAVTILNSIVFVVGNTRYGLCADVPSAAVYTLACMTALVPVYLQLSGISAAQRLVNNVTIAAAFYFSPHWSAMPHNLSSLIMWLALLVGEMVGMHMSSLILLWIQTPSALRGAASPTTPRVKESGEPETLKEMLRRFACQPNFHPDLLCMHWPSLCFEDHTIETLYAANSLVHSRGLHSIATTAAATVCATGIFLSPAFRPLGVLAAVWTALIWRIHQRLYRWRDAPLAYISFSEAYTRLSFLFGVVFLCFSIMATRAGHDAAQALPAGARSMRPGPEYADSYPLLKGIGLGLPTSDLVGVMCGSLLLMLAGAHHRLIVLPPAQRMTNRVIILLGVFTSHLDKKGESLLPSAAHSFTLAACALLMGELIGFSIDHVRRSVFRDWVLELYEAHQTSLKVTANLERMAANAEELERKNASNMAEIAADKRLNHVIKGRCGSAISAVETFRQLLGPYLKSELSDEMSNLITAPLTHLREAIEWCHRRQVFVQLEEGTYVSRYTPVRINLLLEESLANSGTLFSNVTEPLALDVTVLQIALDEIISNALKYRRQRAPLDLVARYSSGMLHVEVHNVNPAEFIPLSAEDLERIFLPGYKAHTCSAMSDGLGLDSVSKAVKAAQGCVRLEQDSVCTTAYISLPATVRTRSHLDDATPDAGLRYPTRSAVKHDREKRGTPLSGRGSSDRSPTFSRGDSSKAPSPKMTSQTARTFGGGRPLRLIRVHSAPDLTSPRPAAGWRSSSPKCIGLTNANHIQSVFISTLFTDYLRSTESMVLSATPSECRGFLDLVLGNRDGRGGCLPPADIVVISHTLFNTDSSGRSLLGARIAQRLRAHGFAGLICVMTSDQTSLEIDETCHHPAVDVVIQSDSLVEDVCDRLLDLHAANCRPSHQTAHPLDRSRIEAESESTDAEETPAAVGGIEAVAPVPNLSRTNMKWASPVAPLRVSPRSAVQPTTPMAPDSPTAAAQAEAQSSGPRVAEEGGAVARAEAPEGAPRTLRVCTLDDESIPRMIQTLFMKHHLHASLEESCTLGATEEEMHSFVDVAMGHLNSDLSPNLGEQRQANVVLLDENILPPQIMGSQLAGELRDRGFVGVTLILTGASASRTDQIRALPAVDLVFDKGHPLPKMAEEVFRVLEQRRLAT